MEIEEKIGSYWWSWVGDTAPHFEGGKCCSGSSRREGKKGDDIRIIRPDPNNANFTMETRTRVRRQINNLRDKCVNFRARRVTALDFLLPKLGCDRDGGFDELRNWLQFLWKGFLENVPAAACSLQQYQDRSHVETKLCHFTYVTLSQKRGLVTQIKSQGKRSLKPWISKGLKVLFLILNLCH